MEESTNPPEGSSVHTTPYQEPNSIQRALAETKESAIRLTDEEISELSDHRSVATPDQKMTAVMEWYLTGSNTKAAIATGNPAVNHQLIYRWRKSKWWGKLIDKCRNVKNHELEMKATAIYHATLEKLLTGIDRGDKKYDSKTGTFYYLPVPSKELAFIANTIQEQRAHLMHRDKGEVKSTDNQLAKIAQQLVSTIQQASKDANTIKNVSGVTHHDYTSEKEIIDVHSERDEDNSSTNL